MNTDRFLRISSVCGYVLMVLALIGLVYLKMVFSLSPLVVVLQIIAVGLMIWARITFGSRSFHYAANPTEGGLVTSGPYRFIRHPIYTAVTLFALAGVAAHFSGLGVMILAILLLGVGVRIYCEERLIVQQYPEYPEYAKHTKRMIPFVF